MQIIFHKKYWKNLKKLPKETQDKAEEVTFLFHTNPFESKLKNHALSGSLKGLRALSVTNSIRILFKEYNRYEKIIFYKI